MHAKLVTYVEARQFRDVVERHLLDFEVEPAFLVDLAEGTVGGALSVLDAQLTLVAHLLQVKALLQAHRVVVLELGVLG